MRIISFTGKGSRLNQRLCTFLNREGFQAEGYAVERFAAESGLTPLQEGLQEWTGRNFGKGAAPKADAVIFIGACGIAVRAIAPFVTDKFTDPAVLAVDELGKYCIPLLSGHVGGANALAETIARMTGAEAVITTATDCNGCFAPDIFASKNQLFFSDRKLAKQVSARLLEGKKIFLSSELRLTGELPKGLVGAEDQSGEALKIEIGYHFSGGKHVLKLVPKVLTLGIGCKKNTDSGRLEAFAAEELQRLCLLPQAVSKIASLDIKKEEQALIHLAEKYQVPFVTFTKEELEAVPGNFTESEFVKSVAGVGNVCERAAVLGSGNGRLLCRKASRDGMTLAVAAEERTVSFE